MMMLRYNNCRKFEIYDGNHAFYTVFTLYIDRAKKIYKAPTGKAHSAHHILIMNFKKRLNAHCRLDFLCSGHVVKSLSLIWVPWLILSSGWVSEIDEIESRDYLTDLLIRLFFRCRSGVWSTHHSLSSQLTIKYLLPTDRDYLMIFAALSWGWESKFCESRWNFPNLISRYL